MAHADISAALTRTGAFLTVDLDAIVQNWQTLRATANGTETAAVVKADAYGLGAVPVATALAAAGCRNFFVAHLSEGLTLRQALPDPQIFVLHGPNPGTEAAFHDADLTPVLNSWAQVQAWADLAAQHGTPTAAALQVDTGMTRLGLSRTDFDRLLSQPETLHAIAPCLLMSHFACADIAGHPLTAQQIARFKDFIRDLPGVPASLSASSGIFLGPQAHFDLIRPGIALYGGSPLEAHQTNPMTPVVTLSARIVHIQAIDAPQTIGYGATYPVPGPSRLATVALGYADGFLRGIGENGQTIHATVNGQFKAPMVGRISMDLTTFDIGAVPTDQIQPGDTIDVIGKYATIDELAAAGRSISYELLTRLGPRLYRVYKGGVTQ